MLNFVHLVEAEALAVQVVNPGNVGVYAGVFGSHLLQDSGLGREQRDGGPVAVVVAEVVLAAVPEVVLGFNTLKDADNANFYSLLFGVTGGGVDGQDFAQSYVHHFRTLSFDGHIQGLAGDLSRVGGPASVQQGTAVFVKQAGHILDAAPGPGVLLQFKAVVARIEECGRFQQVGAVGHVLVEDLGYPLVDQVQAPFVNGRAPGGDGRFFQVDEDAHPEIDVAGLGFPQSAAQGSLRQQVREYDAAGEQGDGKQDAQEQHQFQPPRRGDSPPSHCIGQLQEGHATSGRVAAASGKVKSRLPGMMGAL